MDIPRVDILLSSRANVSTLSVSFRYKSQELITIQLAMQCPYSELLILRGSL